jgi:hypothetical protein
MMQRLSCVECAYMVLADSGHLAGGPLAAAAAVVLVIYFVGIY